MAGGQCNVGILGIGSCVPEKVLDNQAIQEMVDTTDEWIVQRTGIHERRILSGEESILTLGGNAAKAALENAGITAEQIGLIIVATATPDYYSPAIASRLQNLVGIRNCAAFDLNAACTGFVYGLTIAESYVQSGGCEYALVVATEGLTRFVDWEDRATCILFGDGAGAAVLGKVGEGEGILARMLCSDGEGAGLITIPGREITAEDMEHRGGEKKQTIWMDGGKVLKFASRVMTSSIEKVLEMAGLDMSDIALIIPHQANIRIIESAIKRFNLDPDKVFVNVQRYGNTSSASIPIALVEAVQSGRIQKGDNIIVVAFGAGLTYGASLIRWI